MCCRPGTFAAPGEVAVGSIGSFSFQGSQHKPSSWAPWEEAIDQILGLNAVVRMSTHSLAACIGSFHLAIVRCEGHRTEIVGKPGELGAGRGGRRWGGIKIQSQGPTHTALWQLISFPSSHPRGPVCSCFAWLYPGCIC